MNSYPEVSPLCPAFYGRAFLHILGEMGRMSLFFASAFVKMTSGLRFTVLPMWITSTGTPGKPERKARNTPILDGCRPRVMNAILAAILRFGIGQILHRV